jgi:phosphatidylserine/phosphatidylglycerophosphate/cardiolipin synthase-like enzyme
MDIEDMAAISAPLLPASSDQDIQNSTITSLSIGTGYTLYRTIIIPAILSAKREVTLVTCFWAASPTLDLLREALLTLSKRGLQPGNKKIKVRIYFSSSSLPRNLLWPTPRTGQIYSPSSWQQKLGLLPPEDLRGLDLRVKRTFFWPWGIIHSKYVIVDREVAILPSCNVSWERWYEAAVCVRGKVVKELVEFHCRFWEDGWGGVVGMENGYGLGEGEGDGMIETEESSGEWSIDVPTRLLPSPHTPALIPFHLHPRALLSRLPCFTLEAPLFSQTPLLRATYDLLSCARQSITLITPNITEPIVLKLLQSALSRGLRITIWTNKRLMTLEQIVTAGTTTPLTLSSLQSFAQRTHTTHLLKINYFDSHPDDPGTISHPVIDEIPHYAETVPVKLHAKVTIVDGERMIMGSGNMDAASWRTSQELGVLLEGRDVVGRFLESWEFGKLDV